MKDLSVLSEQTSLSFCSINIILGSLLGNMSINIDKLSKAPYIRLKHAVIYKEYFFWKLSLLRSMDAFDLDLSGKILSYTSKPNAKLLVIYGIVKRKGKLVTRKWLNLLSASAISIWWCDCGHITSFGKRAVICVNVYSDIEADIICKYFSNVLKLKVSKYRTKSNKMRISIASVVDFLSIIAKHIPCKVMIKKFIIWYKDDIVTQRWISYLAKISNYNFDTIQLIYLDILNKKKI